MRHILLSVMLRVYTYEKPARPLMGAFMAAAALGATLAAAAGLRTLRAAPEPLGERVRLPGWPIAFAAPRGWSDASDASGGHAGRRWRDEMVFEKAGRAVAAPSLTVFFDFAYPGVTAARAAEVVLNRRLDRDHGEVELRSSRQTVGPLGGELLEAAFVTLRGEQFMLLAVAAAPTGRVVGVEVRGIGRAGALEYRLIRSVCASVELLAPRLARRMEELGGDPPLTVTAPADGWIVLDAEEPHSVGAWLAPGATSAGAWTIQVLPTFLALGRKPADLVRDHLANEAYQLPRVPEIESRTVGDHESAYARYAEGVLTNIAQVIDLGEGRAAMIVGAAEEAHASELDVAAEHAAASVRLGPGRWPYPAEAAAQRGEKRVAQWLGPELAGWLPAEPTGDFFIVEGAGQRVGEFQSVREAARRVSPSHRGGAVTRRHGPGERRIRFEQDSRWAFDVGGRAFQVEERWTDHSGHAPHVASVIQRCTASGEPVQMEVRVADRSRRGTIQPTPHYVPDPLIDPFLSRFAREGGDEPMLVEFSTLAPDGLCAVLLQRVEPQTGPRDDAAAATVVLEVRDYRPWPVQYDFDAGGQLLEVRYFPGLRMVRSADRNADDGGGLLRSLRQWLSAGGRS